MDKIFIKNLEVETIIGFFDWEREVKQLVSISLEMKVDTKRAGVTNKLQDTLNYKKVSKKVISLTQKSKSRLIENLAHKIAKIILSEFAVLSVTVEIQKPGALRGAKSVGVLIERP